MEKKLKKIWVRKTLNGKVMRRGFNFLANKLKSFHYPYEVYERKWIKLYKIML